MARPLARASILHMLPAHLERAGVRPDLVLHLAGLDALEIGAGALVARAQISAALEAAAGALGDATLGLSLGTAADPGRLGATGLALAGGPTLAHGLAAHAAHMPAMQSEVLLGLRLDGRSAILRHRLTGERDDASWVLYEGAAAFYLGMLRTALGPDWSPEHVSFPHACRSRRGAYEAHFGCPVRFGDQDEARMVFSAAWLEHPVGPRRGASPAPYTAEFEQHATGWTESRSDEAAALCAVLGRMISAALPQGSINLAGAARTLGFAPRTLQRTLAADGTSFDALLDSIRHDLATDRLRQGQAPVTEIAMSLGYSDTAHFIRAFRRWEGSSPAAWRAQRTSPGPHFNPAAARPSSA